MPPELESVLFNPDVVEGMVAVLVGILALFAAIIGLGVKKLSDMKKATEEVKETATETKEQVTNNHSTNFRDDVTGLVKTLDALSDTVNEGFRRMDNRFGEAHERQVITDRRVEGVEANARQEYERIWKSIERKCNGY